MAEISKLSRLMNGASRNISLATNTIVVDNIKLMLGGASSATFAGSLTANREITMPDQDVDLGNIDGLVSLSGVSAGMTDLGAFTGSIIPNSRTIKAALQDLETYLETNVSGEFIDSAFRIIDNIDDTKKIAFIADGISSLTTRTITMPDENVDLGNISELITDLSTEIIDRTSADSALDSRVTTLESQVLTLQNVTPAKEKFLMNSVPANLTYIDLAHEAIELTLIVSIDRLLLHEDDDYTISVVGGVTRLTWVGDIAIGGSQALDSTDSVRVKYYYQA
jgi:hypothetical protein